MSWALACSVALCIPILLVHREAYNRLDVDIPVSDTDDIVAPTACRYNDNNDDDNEPTHRRQHARTAAARSDVRLAEPF